MWGMASKRKAADKPVSVVEHVPAPDAGERLRRAFDLVLGAAERDEVAMQPHDGSAGYGEQEEAQDG